MSDNVNITEGSGKTIATDDISGVQYQVIKPAYGVDGAATLVSSSNPLPVAVSSTTGSIGVYFDRGNPTVTANAGTGTFSVFFSPSNPSVNIGTPTIQGITNTVNVAFSPANPAVNPSVAYNSGVVGATTQRVVQATDVASSISIASAPAFALNSGVVGATTIRTVHATDVAGSVNIVAQGLVALNLGTTASLFTASGSASGVSVSGNTLISPSANASFKIYAISVQTTGAVSLTCKLTNGAGTGPTEFWRPLVTASGVTGVQGSNLISRPGAPIFVTGVSTTLSLVLDSASLVHYSIAYQKEAA